MSILTINVVGRPAPQGSKNKGKGGRSYEASQYLPAWRDAIIFAAKQAARQDREWDAMQEAVAVTITFWIERPKSHYVGNNPANVLREGMPLYVNGLPDIDKLCRGVLDSLTQAGVIYDDRRVAQLIASKMYAPKGGAIISLMPLLLNGVLA